MFKQIRKSKGTKILVIWLSITLIIPPNYTWALTGGPSQPEVQSFEPIGTSEMVDPFSGDFTYNIPLIDVGGYPVNLSYNAGVSMDEEASWVGLGCNINPGVINRNMRSVPDDFNGDEITKEFNIKENRNYGVSSSTEIGELFGLKLGKFSIGAGLGISYNNYTGVGLDVSVEPSLSAAQTSKGDLNIGLGLSANSESGVGINPTVSFERKVKKEERREKSAYNAKLGLPFNSRGGLQALTMDISYTTKVKTKKVLFNKKKEKNVQGDFNGGSDISFSTPSYTPQISMPMTNASLSISATLGGEIFGLHGNVRLSGYYSGQYLLNKQETLPAYGYLHTHNGTDKDKVMLDFNREQDGGFTKNKPNLPLTNFSYDIYSVAGQGIGGMYRPFRSDIGILFDSKVQNISGGLNLPGIEVGGGNAAHVGANFSVNAVNSTSGKWAKHNSLQEKLGFEKNKLGSFYEAAYFKQAGEKTVDSDQSFLSKIGGYDPVRVQLNKNLLNVTATSTFEQYPNGVATSPQDLPVTSAIKRQQRQRRNESITFLTAKEAADFGLSKTILDYGASHTIDGNDFIAGTTQRNPNKGQYVPTDSWSRTDYPNHHISEVTALRADGARYVYGIPAYNTTQEDVSFAITGGGPDCQTGLVNYVHGSDDSPDNSKGLDNYYSRTSIPKYAHSYLLTAIISPDYVDLTGNGPSDDDLGTYTKFNYTRGVKDYRWRVPFQKDKANYSEGLKSKKNGDSKGDDKASYIYGVKDIWYVHSIESKTHVAEFMLGNRADGYGVQGKSGGIGSQPMKVLKQIKLYAKPDRVKNPTTATPLKVVHFDYDYSLCKGIHNNENSGTQDSNGFTNQGGKLTLKKLWFTYQNSKKGYLTPYEFEYGQIRKKDDSSLTTINPPYNMKGYDRWSNYKENFANKNCEVILSTPLSTAEYAYVEQDGLPTTSNFDTTNPAPDRRIADENAHAWCLTTIRTPSGGIIKVNYEADDYAFVQDKRAMQMFKVVGATQSVPTMAGIATGPTDQLYDFVSNHNYLIIKLQDTYAAGTPKSQFLKDYLTDKDGKNMKLLYFKFLIDLAKSGDNYEYVPGYASIDWAASNAYGFINNSSDYTHAYIKLKTVEIQDKRYDYQVNPIAQAAWNFTKLYLPRVAYKQSDPSSNAVLQIFESMVSVFESIRDLAEGYNNSARTDGYAKNFVPEKSWIRLYNPNCSKDGHFCS